jgi:hypothetical protein
MHRRRPVWNPPIRDITQVTAGFEHMAYVACEDCRECTKLGNSAVSAWLAMHGACTRFRFFDALPEGYELRIEWLEELAKVGG